MKKAVLIIVLLFILILILFKVFDVYTWCLKKVYSEKYADFVDKYSEEYNLEREWIFALIKAESNFDKDIVSSKGAKGLMQLMENTAVEISKEIGMEEIDLFDAENNIEIGTRYFAKLIKYYDGNYNLAITAYNAGIGNVQKWIDDRIIKKDGSDIQNIPFKETNNYVRKILKNYRVYKELYGDKK